MKKNKKLKKFVLPTFYIGIITIMLLTIFLKLNVNKEMQEETENIDYVSNIIWNNEVPVISTEITIKKPFENENIKIAKYFYDYKSKEDLQQNSIIYYEGTYMQNSGVDYIEEKTFEVKSILDGTVTKIEDNELTGKSIEIKHENNIISVYQGLSEINVKENDVVKQGTTIGKSGTSKINKDLGNHLHFELYIAGEVVNPENYYGKKPNEL